MLVYFIRKIKIPSYFKAVAVLLYVHYGISDIAIVTCVDFQSLFLRPFGRICPIAFRRLFYAINVGVCPTTYPNLFEISSSLLIVQRIDRENLLFLNIGKAKNSRYVIVAVLELCLIKQYLYV